MLTHSRDIDYKIVIQLDDKSLSFLSRVNKRSNAFFRDDRCWEKIVMSRFPYIDKFILNKYRGIRSWYEYYVTDLRKINRNVDLYQVLLTAIKKGRLDHTIIIVNKNILQEVDIKITYVITNALKTRDFEIFKYLVKNGLNFRGHNATFTIHMLLKSKDFEMIKWFLENFKVDFMYLNNVELYLRFPPNKNKNDNRTDADIEDNKNKIIEYMKEKYGYDPILHRHGYNGV